MANRRHDAAGKSSRNQTRLGVALKSYLVALGLAACWFGCLYSDSAAKAEPSKDRSSQEGELKTPKKGVPNNTTVFVSCKVRESVQPRASIDNEVSDVVRVFQITSGQPVLEWIDSSMQSPCGATCRRNTVTAGMASWDWGDQGYTGAASVNRINGRFHEISFGINDNVSGDGECSRIDDPTAAVKPKF